MCGQVRTYTFIHMHTHTHVVHMHKYTQINQNACAQTIHPADMHIAQAAITVLRKACTYTHTYKHTYTPSGGFRFCCVGEYRKFQGGAEYFKGAIYLLI